MNKSKAKKYISERIPEITLEANLTISGRLKERLDEEMAFLNYVDNLLDAEENQESEIFEFHHKGYTLQQSSYNWHYMIFRNNTMVCHSQYSKKLTEKEAKEQIENHILMHRMIKKEGDQNGGNV